MKLKRNPITIVYSAVFVLIMALALMNLAVLTYEKFAVDGLENVLAGIVLVVVLIFFIGAFFIKEGEKLRGIENKSAMLVVLEVVLLVACVGGAFYLSMSSSITRGIYIGVFLALVYGICRLVGGRFCSLVGLLCAFASVFYYYEVGNSVFVEEEYINVFCILIPYLLFVLFIRYIVPALAKKSFMLIVCELLMGFVFAIAIVMNPVAIWLLVGCFLSLIFGRGKEAYNTMTKGLVVGGLITVFAIILTVVMTLVIGGDITSIVSMDFDEGFNTALADGSVISYGFEKISDELNAYIIAPYPYGIFPTLLALFAALGGVYTAMRRLSEFGGMILATLGSLVWYMVCATEGSNNYYYLLLIPIVAAYGLYNSLFPEKLSSVEEDEETEEDTEEAPTLDVLLDGDKSEEKDSDSSSKSSSKSMTIEEELDRRAEKLLRGNDAHQGSVVDDFDKAAKDAAVEAFKAELDRREREKKAEESEEKEPKRTAEELTQSLADLASDSSTARPGYSAPVPIQRSISAQAPKIESKTDANTTSDDLASASHATSTAKPEATTPDSHFMEWHVSEEFIREEEIAEMKKAKMAEEVTESDTDNIDVVNDSVDDTTVVQETGIDESGIRNLNPDNIEFEEEENNIFSGVADDEEEKNVTLDSSELKSDREDEEKHVTLDADVGYTEAPTNRIDPTDTSMIGKIDEETQPLADRRIPEEMTINAVNDGEEGAVHSSFIPEADSVLGGASKAKYETSEALLSTPDSMNDSDDNQEDAREQAEELLSAIEHTVVPSVELPDISEFENGTDTDESDESDESDTTDESDEDMSMMKMHETIADKESLASEGLQAVDDISGKLSAAAATLRGDGAGVMSPGEDEMLDNLLDRLDMSDSIRRMTMSAREDMADVIESDAEPDTDEGEDEVVLSNDAYDFGADDEYGEVPTISDLEDRWRAEAELDKSDSEIPDVVSADEVTDIVNDNNVIDDVADDLESVDIQEEISVDELSEEDISDEELSEESEIAEVEEDEMVDDENGDSDIDDFSFEAPTGEEATDSTDIDNNADIADDLESVDIQEEISVDELSDKEVFDDDVTIDSNIDDSSFEAPISEKVTTTLDGAQVELTEIDQSEEISDDNKSTDKPVIDEEINIDTSDNISSSDELVNLDEIEDDTSDISMLEGATEEVEDGISDISMLESATEEVEDSTSDLSMLEGTKNEIEGDMKEVSQNKTPSETKPVEFNDLVKLVFEDDEDLGIPKPGEESTERLEQAISREKHRNLFDENIHTENVVKRTTGGTRSYHKIVIKKD